MDILTGHLCRVKGTPAFIGPLAFQEMRAATVKSLSTMTQKRFIESLIRILILLMTNVDRPWAEGL
jgi:hypothetical protein